MFGLKTYVSALKHKKAQHFLKINLILVLFFALAYRLADEFVHVYPELSHKLSLGSIKQVDDFYSYLYFSLITQSGVGFGGILPDGNNVITTKSKLIRGLSLMQLVSVLIMITWTL